MPDVEDPIVIPKKEDFNEESPASSLDSGAENDAEGDADGNVDLPPIIPQKRKGGRKPIYATSEERKQRNRQAQAAFRERRTEYIKELEATMKRQEESLQALQKSHRIAADECLMLRYKNSLLERILLEKGIDVQAELRRKEVATPSRLLPTLPQPVPISKPTARARHMSRLSSGSAAAKAMPSSGVASGSSSQVSSPMKSPGYGGMSIPYQSPQSNVSGQSRISATRSTLQPIAPVPPQGHWPSPFQSHNEQLEQEYGTHADMIDADDQPEEIGPGPYPEPFPQSSFPTAHPGYAIPVSTGDAISTGHQSGFGNHTFDNTSPMLDADPFGLSASMHFPTPFTYQESSIRK